MSLYVENYDLLNTFQFISVKNIVRIALKISVTLSPRSATGGEFSINWSNPHICQTKESLSLFGRLLFFQVLFL